MKAAWTAVLVVGVVAGMGTLSGCGNSIYHQARNMQPSDLSLRVKARVEEGRKLAEAARADLAHVTTAKDERDRAIRVELLAVRGHDLSRAASAITDVTSRMDGSSAKSAAMDAAKAFDRAGKAVAAAGEGPEDGRAARLTAAGEALGAALEAAGRVAGH